MKAVKTTGLVPVKSSKDGSVFGVSPDAAAKGVEAGDFTLVAIPDGIETIVVSTGRPEVKTEAPVSAGSHPDIPNDWEDMHHLQQIKLAMKLKPGFQALDGESKSNAAIRVIRDVLAGEGEKIEPENEDDDGDTLVEIPADWEKQHHAARIALAEKLSGKNIELTDEEKAKEIKVSDKADDIIRTELEQRAAAGNAQE